MPKITQNGRELREAVHQRYSKDLDAETASRICRLAQNLHTQSENVCSYQWADTPAYRLRCELTEARVEKYAKALAPLGLTLTYQGDPRGLALKLHPIGVNPNDSWCDGSVGQVGLM